MNWIIANEAYLKTNWKKIRSLDSNYELWKKTFAHIYWKHMKEKSENQEFFFQKTYSLHFTWTKTPLHESLHLLYSRQQRDAKLPGPWGQPDRAPHNQWTRALCRVGGERRTPQQPNQTEQRAGEAACCNQTEWVSERASEAATVHAFTQTRLFLAASVTSSFTMQKHNL